MWAPTVNVVYFEIRTNLLENLFPLTTDKNNLTLSSHKWSNPCHLTSPSPSTHNFWQPEAQINMNTSSCASNSCPFVETSARGERGRYPRSRWELSYCHKAQQPDWPSGRLSVWQLNLIPTTAGYKPIVLMDSQRCLNYCYTQKTSAWLQHEHVHVYFFRCTYEHILRGTVGEIGHYLNLHSLLHRQLLNYQTNLEFQWSV